MTLFHIKQKYLRISAFIIVKIIIFAIKEITMKITEKSVEGDGCVQVRVGCGAESYGIGGGKYEGTV